jgi:large conductance mechanosensitive channel
VGTPTRAPATPCGENYHRPDVEEETMLKGFKEFVVRGNVVDLAVAVVVGTAFSAVVKALVADIMTPLIAAIGGQPDFSNLYFTLHGSKFLYGDLVDAAIGFLMVAAAVYLFVVYPMNKFAERRARGTVKVEELAPDVVLLAEIRDLLAERQGAAE